ncbi:cytochrome c peroxidase [Thiohalobacter sp. IOR34]|uniref:cytochrome-c peroxidase n=1 Tax=Thiohalobacter sp. IOR34 TaxID=3057176 RepID=UPI0025B02F4A|nr:cytochrome c peroxidase [Thiohalobacter sp. IOR34]WJW74386.1 cytochrome c peroxidase [Thiohalobacter sp. IOR34]
MKTVLTFRVHWQRSLVLFLGLLLPVVALAGHPGTVPDMPQMPAGNEPVLPLPPPPVVDPLKLELGRRLFYDPILSADGAVACVSCHDLADNGAQRVARPVVRPGQRHLVNAPTVFNASLNAFQFWDGRAGSLEEQIDSVVRGELEFATSWPELVARLKAREDYVQAFQRVYADGITPANVRDAIASFERTLLTPGSRFDRYLRGDEAALSAEEKQGYQLFKDYGCTACHQGVNLGGNLFQRLGIFGDFFAARDEISSADLGRFTLTGREQDRHVFRVPSLRNVAVTAPYFHDGSVTDLKQAVRLVARYQLGRIIPERDLSRILAFLKTLTGSYEGRPLDGKRR